MAPRARSAGGSPSEAAPRADKACSTPLPGAGLSGPFCPSWLWEWCRCLVKLQRTAAIIHERQELAPHPPCRVVRNPQVPMERHCRHAALIGRHVVEPEEPVPKRNLRRIEHRPRSHGGLAPTAHALVQRAIREPMAAVVAAMGAAESIGPSPAMECLVALLLGPVASLELPLGQVHHYPLERIQRWPCRIGRSNVRCRNVRFSTASLPPSPSSNSSAGNARKCNSPHGDIKQNYHIEFIILCSYSVDFTSFRMRHDAKGRLRSL